MASISTDKRSGARTVWFTAANRKRKKITLGKVPLKLAEQVKWRVKELNVAAILGMPIDSDTAVWLARIGDELAGKLAAVGLIPARRTATLSEWCTAYIGEQTDAAPSTLTNLRVCAARLVEHLGAGMPLRDITEQHAEAWHRWLKTQYEDGTTHRTVGRARQMFKAALRRKLVADNVFSTLKPSAAVDKSRQAYIDTATIEKVIEECPPWLAVIVALSRHAGLRIPCELKRLMWSDVLTDRIHVDSPKTGERFVPITPALRPHLERAYDLASKGAVYVVESAAHRVGHGNTLRKPLLAAITRAGYPSWGKLFTNLRASCTIDMTKFPPAIAAMWMGHSVAIASKHYVQVLEDHFREASGVAESVAPSERNRLHHAATPSHTESQCSTQPLSGCVSMEASVTPCVCARSVQAPRSRHSSE